MTRLFVTGATGFVGRRFIASLPADAVDEVVYLTRDGAQILGLGPRLVPVEGDLLEPAAWADALTGCDAVLHLAAATGAASAEEHWRVNARGTELLLDACARAGVPRFIHVSTVATTFGEVGDYPYAASNRQAEEAVRASSLSWTILRPTLIVGPGGGAWKALAALARVPVIPIPGPGDALVQPVWVGDVAQVLLEAVAGDRWAGMVVDVAGPEQITIEDLLRRIRRRRRGADPLVVHVPIGTLATVLAWLEQRGARLPVTAGQLRSFREDGTARPDDHRAAPLVTTPLDTMIDRALGGAQVSGERLTRECDVLCRWIIGEPAERDVVEQYIEAHRWLGPRVDTIDGPVAFARRGVFQAGLADAWTRVFRPTSVLRRKATLLVAILECRPETAAAFEAPDRRPHGTGS